MTAFFIPLCAQVSLTHTHTHTHTHIVVRDIWIIVHLLTELELHPPSTYTLELTVAEQCDL